jgi:hypothetical protein
MFSVALKYDVQGDELMDKISHVDAWGTNAQ